MTAHMVMREYVTHNNRSEANNIPRETLMTATSITGGSGQTDVFQSVGMMKNEFFGPESTIASWFDLLTDHEEFYTSITDHFPVS